MVQQLKSAAVPLQDLNTYRFYKFSSNDVVHIIDCVRYT